MEKLKFISILFRKHHNHDKCKERRKKRKRKVLVHDYQDKDVKVNIFQIQKKIVDNHA